MTKPVKTKTKEKLVLEPIWNELKPDRTEEVRAVIAKTIEKVKEQANAMAANDWVINTLKEAENQIETHGWTQHYFEGPDGAVCLGESLVRALLVCNGQNPDLFKEQLKSKELEAPDNAPWCMGHFGPEPRADIGQCDGTPIAYVAKELGVWSEDTYKGIPRWNDAQGRTKAEVLIMIRFAMSRRRRDLGTDKPSPWSL